MIISFMQIIIILSLGLVITFISARIFSLSFQRALVLFIWHTFFSFVYAWYVAKFGGDANFYYYANNDSDYLAKLDTVKFGFSSLLIVSISNLLYEFANLSFFSMNIVFGIFGTIGLLAFDSSLRFISKDSSKKIKLLNNIIVFLPSASFWSSGLGKDSIVFMCINLIVWASLNLGNRKLIFVVGLILLYWVRPHVGVILFSCFSFTLLINNNLKLFTRIALFTIFLIILLLALPHLLEFLGFRENLTLKNIIAYIESRQNLNHESWTGGFDIRNMSFLTKVLTYLFRPLPFEAHNVFVLFASIENMFLLYLLAIGLIAKLSNRRVVANQDLNTLFFLIYIIILLIVLSLTTANFGISVRQKWMFLPFLFVLLISYVAQTTKKKN